MNAERRDSDDEASRINEESSSKEDSTNRIITSSDLSELLESNVRINTAAEQFSSRGAPTSAIEEAREITINAINTNIPNPEMKRSAVKELIERYFYQLQRGCGNPKCNNKYCASSGEVEEMTPNQIAARAIQLFSEDAKLCDSYSQPSKVPRTQESNGASSSFASHSTSDAAGLVGTMTSPSPVEQDSGVLLANDSFTSGSSSSTRSNSNTSTPTTSSRTSSSNTNISSFTGSLIQSPTAYATTLFPQTTAQAAATEASVTTASTSSQAKLQTKQIPASGGASKKTSRKCTSVSNAGKTITPKTKAPPTPTYLDEQIIDDLIAKCKEENSSYDKLINLLGEVFSSYEKLGKSFRRDPNKRRAESKIEKLLLEKKPSDLLSLKKEDIRTLEGETDKDEDSTILEKTNVFDDDSSLSIGPPSNLNDTYVDLNSLRRSMKKIYQLHISTISDTINIAVGEFSSAVNMDMSYKTEAEAEAYMHSFVICFDLTMSAELDYLESALPKLCHAARHLSVSHHARLARIWAAQGKDHLRTLVESFQQIITLEVITDEEYVQESLYITAVTRVLKIAFYASILAGKIEKPKTIETAASTAAQSGEKESATGTVGGAAAEEDDFFFYTHKAKPNYKFAEDKLEIELGISAMDCRVPLLPYEEFYNDALSEVIQMDRDYLNYKNLLIDPNGVEEMNFTFMLYSFILLPTTKVIALYYDSRIRMFSERSSSLYTLVNFFGDSHEPGPRPDLKLKVRRDNIIDDALVGLEMVAMSNPKDFKKQLVVEFVGEQGIDEGGVSKEFFQLIIEELFNPDFGMFTYQEDTKTVWFNSMPFENEAQFTLIGIILGLAIYNHVILAVNFPMVAYRKLMGGRGSFYDLEDWNPTLYRSLKSMIEYEGDDMEECFMQTFKIRYNDVYGEVVEYELKPDGGDIAVGQENKQEFVDLYSDYLLNKSIDRQFMAFKKGFDMVTDESPLKLLFRPEEIELLVCGSKNFDFVELEKSTDYEGGYTRESKIIVDFWSIVHALPDELKRKLLEFTTGSDRVPVGGLSRLKLLITRHGPDSDRLPTSHTCFNVLLLPEYTSKEKLEERLLKAIKYSKGFGML